MKKPARSSTRSALRWALALLVSGTVVSGWSATAHAADNSLTSATPAPNSTVDVSPQNLTLVFAAPLGPSPQVSMTCGDPVVVQSLGQATLLADQLTVQVQLLAPAPKGTCTVSWVVTDPSLQPAGSGSFAFAILNETAATVASTTTAPVATGDTGVTTTTAAPVITTGGSDDTTTSSTETGGTSGPLGLFRLLSTLGMVMLFGGLVVVAVAWPEGVEYLLTVRYLRAAWGLAVVGTFLFVGALEAHQTGGGLGASVVPTAWGDLLDTTSGKAAILRFLFVLAAAYVVMRPERAIDPATQLPALVPAGLAVVTLGFSRDEFGLIEYAAGAVHALAMAVWLGGLVLLTRVVLAGPGDEDLVHAVRGFARMSNPALVATVVTGGIQLYELDRGSLGSSHGLVLIVKTLFVALMVFVGVAARQFISQRVSRANTMTAPLASRLRRALGIEAVVGVVVLGLTSWLLALSPPGLDAAPQAKLDLSATHEFLNPGLGADVLVAFSERVGVNDVRIEVKTPSTGLSGLSVEFLAPQGAAGTGMAIEPIPLTGAGVAVMPKSAGFALNATGTWTVVVKIAGQEVARQDVYVSDGSAAATTSTGG